MQEPGVALLWRASSEISVVECRRPTVLPSAAGQGTGCRRCMYLSYAEMVLLNDLFYQMRSSKVVNITNALSQSAKHPFPRLVAVGLPRKRMTGLGR
jgi:hypothetical protein